MDIKLIQSQFISTELIVPNIGQIPDVPKNPRFIRDEKFEALKKSIIDNPEMLGLRELMVYPFEGTYVAIGGNQRLAASTELGIPEIPCKVLPVETDAETLRTYILKDNYAYGENDNVTLSESYLDDCERLDMTDMLGFDLNETEEEENVSNIQPDNSGEVKMSVPVFVNSGDVWQIGRHRLMCGDSTDESSVAILLDGNKTDISFTSPPYGAKDISLLREHKEKGKVNAKADGFYDKHEDKKDGWFDLICSTYENMKKHSSMQFINIQMLADNKVSLINWMNRYVDEMSDIIIWNKSKCAPQIQRNVLNSKFEFIFAFGSGSRLIKFGDFKGNVNNVIDDVVMETNKYSDIHKAVFPIDLPKRVLEINSKATSVLDLFGGTGTTMIAAETKNVSSYLMEMSEQYCSVIIERYIGIYGSDNVFLVSNGEKIHYDDVISNRT